MDIEIFVGQFELLPVIKYQKCISLISKTNFLSNKDTKFLLINRLGL